jgi:hypothetical protein
MNKPLGPEEQPVLEPENSGEIATAEEMALKAFDAWMDRQLEVLVARWVHLAAPNADHPAGRRRNYF